MTSNFVDDRHTLYCGWVLGIAMRYGMPWTPVIDDEGNFTDRITIALPNGLAPIEFVIAYPPDDWQLGGPNG